MPSVLVVGWDGATWDVLQPLLQSGRLPNLQRLIGRGVAAPLQSTLPPVTASAWSSFMTGLLPANHGLLSWQKPLRTPGLRRPWIDAHALQGKRLWHTLGEAGYRVGMVNVPLTYPPQPVNGFLVSGMLTPSVDCEFTYPPDLRQRLLAQIPDYTPDVELQHTEWETVSDRGFNQFVQAVQRGIEQRLAAVQWLAATETPDFLMVVFEAPDRLQHLLWHYITEDTNAIRNTQYAIRREAVLKCYEQCDAALPEIPGFDDPNTFVIMLSDHGFGPLNTNLHVNDWLAAQGYLRWAQGKAGARGVLRQLIAPIKHLLPQALRQRGRTGFNWMHTVDWASTQAYSGLPTEEGVWVNLQGREPFGCVPQQEYEQVREALIRALRALRHPVTGTPVVLEVLPREQRHHGAYAENAPDVVFTLACGYRMTPGAIPLKGKPIGFPYFQDVSSAGHGIHDPKGILVLAGPDVTAQMPIPNAHLADLMPTIVSAFGIPVPAGLDGKVLLPDFEFQVHGSSQFSEPQYAIRKMPHAYSADEEDLLTERLRGLGYLE